MDCFKPNFGGSGKGDIGTSADGGGGGGDGATLGGGGGGDMKEVEVAEIGGGKEELAADSGGDFAQVSETILCLLSGRELGPGTGDGDRLARRVESVESILGRRRGSLVGDGIVEKRDESERRVGASECHSGSDGCTK